MKRRQLPMKAVRVVTALLIAAFFWAFQARAVKSHFGPDELMNIYSYWHAPLWRVLLANLTFWSAFVRPMAAAYYLPLFHWFGLNPAPYGWVRIGLLALNTILFYNLALRLSRSWWVANLASLPVAYQANLGNLSYNGAFIYDILCGGFYFAALLYYVRVRTSKAFRAMGSFSVTQACIFLTLYICALDSKEMAVSLPVVVLAYELLLHEHRPGFRNLARNVWPTLAAGALTVVFILGKTFGTGGITNLEAYRPVLSWNRFSESSTRFFDAIFYVHGLTMWHCLVIWGALLCIGIVALVRPIRDPRWMFLWIFVLVTPLPVVFLPNRGGAVLYIVVAGWAILAAMFCRELAWRLAQNLFSGRPARLCAMGLFWLSTAAAYANETRTVHRTFGYLFTGTETAEAIREFQNLNLHPKHGSSILFLRSPFPGDSFDTTFLAALGWNDLSLRIFQQSQAHLPEDQIAGMDYVIDYTGGEFVVRRPAGVEQRK
jgi:hypothetical protein